MHILREYIPKMFLQWLDDLIRHAKTMRQLIGNWRTLLELCEKFNIKLSIPKTLLGTIQIKFCGHLINEKGFLFENKELQHDSRLEVSGIGRPSMPIRELRGLDARIDTEFCNYITTTPRPSGTYIQEEGQPEEKRTQEVFPHGIWLERCMSKGVFPDQRRPHQPHQTTYP